MPEPSEPELTIVDVDTQQVDGTIGLAEIAHRLRDNAPQIPGVPARAAAANPDLARRLRNVERLAEQLAQELEAIDALRPPPT
jgi:ABC-type transporter Mla subunit MlaD